MSDYVQVNPVLRPRRQPRQAHKHDHSAVFKFIVDYKKNNDGASPSMREISKTFDISSLSHVRYILGRLEVHGKIKLTRAGEARRISVVGGQWKYNAETEADPDTDGGGHG